MVASPVRCGSEEPPAHPAPGLGAHTEELLQEIGYDNARIGALRNKKVI
jgi:crotonobetainyl-CoA:carnitine CoA-transferase CaiB-like acyl-CoA transferase